MVGPFRTLAGLDLLPCRMTEPRMLSTERQPAPVCTNACHVSHVRIRFVALFNVILLLTRVYPILALRYRDHIYTIYTVAKDRSLRLVLSFPTILFILIPGPTRRLRVSLRFADTTAMYYNHI